MVVEANRDDEAKLKSRLASVLKSGRKVSSLTATQPTHPYGTPSSKLYGIENTGCIAGSVRLSSDEPNTWKGCSGSSCPDEYPATSATRCSGKQGNACCKRKDYRNGRFHESDCLSICDLRLNLIDNHASCRKRHPETKAAKCHYMGDLFVSLQQGYTYYDTCCVGEYVA